MDGCFVVSPTDASHIPIEDHCTEFLGDTFRASEHRRVVVEEIHPVVDIHPHRFLVSYEAYHRGLAGIPVFEHLPKRFLHRYADRSKALAYVEEETVEGFVLDGVIDLGNHCLG